MNCAVHSNVEASGYCRNCGKPMCPECTRNVGGALYCEPCLAAKVATVPPAAPTGSNPGLAMAWDSFPGWARAITGST